MGFRNADVGWRGLRLTVSPDGYVRLPVTAYQVLPLTHVLSELDSEAVLTSSLPAGATVTSIAGVTEWASANTPAVSLGWDWRLSIANGEVCYERSGEVRSNVMLLDARGRDVGPVGTGVLLSLAVDALPWQSVVEHYITQRYTCHLSNLTVTKSRLRY